MQSTGVEWPGHDELSGLVRAVRAGGPPAVDRLLAAVRPSLAAYFARRFPGAVAEDLAQEALLRIAGAARRIDPERADRYVMTVARNVLRTEYRRRAREARRQVPLALADDVEAPDRLDAQVEYRELARAIHRASLEALPPPLRDIVLGLLGGLTPSEIADRQHLNPITIRTRMLRARGLLRERLRSFLEDDTEGPPPSSAGGGAGGRVPDE